MKAPRVPAKITPEETAKYMQEFSVILQKLIDRIRPRNQGGYASFANLTVDRTLDADATTLGEVADVLGTLIEDLKEARIIKE